MRALLQLFLATTPRRSTIAHTPGPSAARGIIPHSRSCLLSTSTNLLAAYEDKSTVADNSRQDSRSTTSKETTTTMKEVTGGDSVGDIVSALPSSAKVFQRHDIDFCCAGRVALQTACDDKGLDASKVLQEIRESSAEVSTTPGERSWDGEEDVDVIVDYILEQYHQPLKLELPRLEKLVQKVASVHGDRHPELKEMETIFRGLKDELLSHLDKEENVLFPLMGSIYASWKDPKKSTPVARCGSVNNAIRVMEAEHDSAGEALRALRHLSGGDYVAPEDACNSYRVLFVGLSELEGELHRHIHLENSVLHPLTSRMEWELQEK